MTKGDTVWIHPHGSPDGAVAATVDLISTNGRSIALRLHDKPSWCVVKGSFLLHTDDMRVEMLLTREAIDGRPIGPWIEVLSGGHYEIEEVKPC